MIQNLASLTCVQLRELLCEIGFKIGGKTAELINWIYTSAALCNVPDKPPEDEAELEYDKDVDYCTNNNLFRNILT